MYKINTRLIPAKVQGNIFVCECLQTNTKARMEFDLSRYTDFLLHFPGKQTPGTYRNNINSLNIEVRLTLSLFTVKLTV